jgi:sugar/nucleoside kinase (ribokinase family)
VNKGQESVVVVGSVAFDTIETRGVTREKLLGGSGSFFSVAASHFAPVRLVGVVGEDFPEAHLELFRGRGVDTSGVERRVGKTFHWSGRYTDDLSQRTTLATELNVFADFQPKLPDSWRRSDWLFLGNIHPALQLDVLDQVASSHRPKLVAMDTMNFWIGGELALLKKVLARVDLIVVNDEEARQLSGEHSLPAAARAIGAMGPGTVIVKRGDAGALLFHDKRVFAAPALPLEEVLDPTGAGDSFAGGFMGSLARDGSLTAASVRRAMFYGSVMASFCVEGFSLDRLKTVETPEIAGRYRAFCELTHFEDLPALR